MNRTLLHLSEIADRIAEEVIVGDAGRAEDARDIARHARADAERLGPADIDAVVMAREVVDDLAALVTGRYPLEASRPLTPDRVALALLCVLIGVAKAPRTGPGYRGLALVAAAEVTANLRVWGTELAWFLVDEQIEWVGKVLCPRPVAAAQEEVHHV